MAVMLHDMNGHQAIPDTPVAYTHILPDVRVVAQTKEALLVGKHDPLGDNSVVLCTQGVRFLPGYELLPQLQLRETTVRVITHINA